MPSNRISYRLRATMASIFFILFALVLVTVSYLYQISQSQAAHYSLLSDLSSLESESSQLRSRGEYYVENAPRDYDTYFRDVAVYHKEMLGDIDRINERFVKVLNDYQKGGSSVVVVFNRWFYGTEWTALGESVAQSEHSWQKFRAGLNTALGENQLEPRLEWGAKYIVNNAKDLSSELSKMTESYRSLVNRIDSKSKNIAFFSILITALFMIVGLLFMQWVVQRIGVTAKACERVANGDFGYQLADNSSDEIGVMTKSFNSLSGRIKLILGLLTKLNTSREPGDALETFWSDSKEYFDTDWMGLMIQTTDGKSLALTHQKSESVNKAWQNGRIDLFSGSEVELEIAKCLVNQKALLIEKNIENTGKLSAAPFFRELVQKTMPSSLVVLPLVNHDKSWKAVLILAKGLHKHFDEEQLSLLKNLAPVIGSIFANATSNKTVKRKA